MLNRHVLVVEDDESVRKTLVDYLTQESRLEVDGARDGVDALHHILMTDYEVVILDMMMPKMSGGDVLDSVLAMTCRTRRSGSGSATSFDAFSASRSTAASSRQPWNAKSPPDASLSNVVDMQFVENPVQPRRQSESRHGDEHQSTR